MWYKKPNSKNIRLGIGLATDPLGCHAVLANLRIFLTSDILKLVPFGILYDVHIYFIYKLSKQIVE